MLAEEEPILVDRENMKPKIKGIDVIAKRNAHLARNDYVLANSLSKDAADILITALIAAVAV